MCVVSGSGSRQRSYIQRVIRPNSQTEGATKFRYRMTKNRSALPRSDSASTNVGALLSEPNDDARKRLGRSPDRADALILALSDGVCLRVETPIVAPHTTPHVPFYEPYSVWESA